MAFRKFSQWFDRPIGKASNKPEGRSCAYPGCSDEGTYRAPKSRYHLESGVDDWYWFCLTHIRDYNARWNYYDHMSEEQIDQERRADITWQRPSWPLGSSHNPWRQVAGAKRQASAPFGPSFQDPFGLFSEGPPSQTAYQSPFAPESPEETALAALGLSYPFSQNDLRKKYRLLVKKHHPDANKGSRESEEAIKRINEAYKILKKVCS